MPRKNELPVTVILGNSTVTTWKVGINWQKPLSSC